MKYSILLLLFTLLLSNESDSCIRLYARYNIDTYIKTDRGWLRICNNDKLRLYTITEPSLEDKYTICKCFKLRSTIVKDRNIEGIKND